MCDGKQEAGGEGGSRGQHKGRAFEVSLENLSRPHLSRYPFQIKAHTKSDIDLVDTRTMPRTNTDTKQDQQDTSPR